MQIKTDGITIRDLNVGEQDRILTILTREKGVIRASARGARRVRSQLLPATQLLCYAGFTLFRGKEKYIIDEAEPKEMFRGVLSSLDQLSLAQYFAQLCGFVVPEEEPAEIYLRLMLNALHLLESGKRPPELIKAAFEMRLLTVSGYMPDLVACRGCGSFEAEKMFFLPKSGEMICENCLREGADTLAGTAAGYGEKAPLSRGALAALRHTVYADFEKLFSFSLPEKPMKELSWAAERYLLAQLERSFPTLEFYHGLT